MEILIYSNSKIFGGVEIIIYRFCEYLKYRKIKFKVVENNNTYLASLIGRDNICSTNDDSIVDFKYVFLANFCKVLEPQFLSLKSELRVLSWIVHPNELYTSFYKDYRKLFRLFGYNSIYITKLLSRRKYNLNLNLINKVTKNNGLCVMDEACARSISFFYPAIENNIKIIPVPVPVVNYSTESYSCNDDILRFGYFGRMDKMKFSALIGIIEEISLIDNSEFHFVGKGSYVPKLKKTCRDKKIKFYDYGFRDNLEARSILKKNVQLLFGMGISVLDIASEGVPCLLIDPNITFFTKKQSKFRFVHQIEGYSLGEYRDFPYYKEGEFTLSECIDKLKYNNFGIQGKQYVIEKHNPVNVFDELLKNILASNVSVDDYKSRVII